MKELYKLVNTLMGTTWSNPLPNHTNNKLLADKFTDFFMNKIQKIRNNLIENPVYQPKEKAYPAILNSDHLLKQKLEKSSSVWRPSHVSWTLCQLNFWKNALTVFYLL